MEVAKLFNGMQVHSSVELVDGQSAIAERQDAASYALDLAVKVRIPTPETDFLKIRALNDHLPDAIFGAQAASSPLRASRFYRDFYRIKIANLQQNLGRIDQLLSRRHFYDCETILELEHPASRRKALFIQAQMDVDTDGSDSDRVATVDASSSTFQPITSYRWPKRTAVPNPFLAGFEAKLRVMEVERDTQANSGERDRQVRDAIGNLRYEIGQVKKNSFLVAELDPYIVLPGFMLAQTSDPFAPKLGDFCVVIFKDQLYPAIFGDVGPNDKIGEASLRLGREINAAASANISPVTDLKVSYLVFPGSALTPPGPPDYAKWTERCAALMTELGGWKGELHKWEDLTKPMQSPSPSPSPTLPSPVATPAVPSPSASP